MVSLADLANGPKMLKEAFGRRTGMAIWRVVLLAVALGIVAVGLTHVSTLTQLVFGVPKGTPKDAATSNTNCSVIGSTNYGSISQNCEQPNP